MCIYPRATRTSLATPHMSPYWHTMQPSHTNCVFTCLNLHVFNCLYTLIFSCCPKDVHSIHWTAGGCNKYSFKFQHVSAHQQSSLFVYNCNNGCLQRGRDLDKQRVCRHWWHSWISVVCGQPSFITWQRMFGSYMAIIWRIAAEMVGLWHRT